MFLVQDQFLLINVAVSGRSAICHLNVVLTVSIFAPSNNSMFDHIEMVFNRLKDFINL